MQSIPNPSWVYNITVCSTYGTGFALKLLRVRSLLVVDYQIIIILSSYNSKSPCQCHAGGPDSYFFYCIVTTLATKFLWGSSHFYCAILRVCGCKIPAGVTPHCTLNFTCVCSFLKTSPLCWCLLETSYACRWTWVSLTLEWCTGCGSIAWINCFNNLGRLRLAQEEHEYRTGSR